LDAPQAQHQPGRKIALIGETASQGQRPLAATAVTRWKSRYLELHPDIKSVVEAGILASGFEHFALYGRFETRAIA
jgi:hypothetical protein